MTVASPLTRSRLRIFSPVPRKQSQDCGGCRNVVNCWMPGIKDEHIITNMLVCRIKRGIEVNKASRLFIQMVRPKLKLLARQAVRGTRIDLDIALADMESEVLDYIQNHYIMGEIAYPLHRLFNDHNGHMKFYASNYARSTRRYEDTHLLPSSSDEALYDEATTMDEEETDTDVTRRARDIIDDGLTLSLAEYRVMKFCLSNASDAKRPLNGLHVYLSRSMGVVRARVTKVWADASKKVVEETRAAA